MKDPYPEYLMESVRTVEETREERLEKDFERISEKEGQNLLQKYHPDYKKENKRKLRVGQNKGDVFPNEVVNLLEANPLVNPNDIDLNEVDYETDILVLGAGGAGLAACLWANNDGVDVDKIILATKLRLGDSNSKMSQGGIQGADNENDSPLLHFLDIMNGGHYTNNPALAKVLAMDGPLCIEWLESLGAIFDKEPDGHMKELLPGGGSRLRIKSCRDYTGLELVRVLMDEVKSRGFNILEFAPAVALLSDGGYGVGGAILWNLETKEYKVVKAKTTIITTGGFGRLHIADFPTTNHYGATMDGVVLGYRIGAKLSHLGATQFHPTGAAYPEQILGLLITEKCRSLGSQIVNNSGEATFYPLETRDVEASLIIKEVEDGRGLETPTGQPALWLDTPLIDMINGDGTFEESLPYIYRLFSRFNIDPTKVPIMIYPTLHYQNGGLSINENSQVLDVNDEPIKGLLAAGEISGGVHGENRLMGNSQLELYVYGRRAGFTAAEYVKKNQMPKKLSLDHLVTYKKRLEEAGIETDRSSPILLPEYRGPNAINYRGYGTELPIKKHPDLLK